MGDEYNDIIEWKDSRPIYTGITYNNKNFNPILNNEAYVNELLIPYIEKLQKTKLNLVQRSFISNGIKNLPLTDETFKGNKLATTTEKLAIYFIEKMKLRKRSEELSVKEYQKKIMGDVIYDENQVKKITNVVGADAGPFVDRQDLSNTDKKSGFDDPNQFHNIIKEYIAPSIRTAYPYCDTKYRRLVDDGTKKFSWDYTNTVNVVQGSVNVSENNFGNVISVKMLPFRLPYKSDFLSNGQGRISVLIEEFSAQSVIAHEDRRYHFIGEAKADGGNVWIDVNPYQFNDGVYKFNKPFSITNTLTLTFGDPIQKLTFDTDRFICSVSYNNPALFTIDNGTSHGLIAATDYVIISGFNILNPTTTQNTYINTINNPKGILVNTTPSASTFTVNVDLTSVVNTYPAPALTGTATATFNATTLTGSGTNWIADLTGNSFFIYNPYTFTFNSFGVSTVNSNTSVTLVSPYIYPSYSGLVLYVASAGTISISKNTKTVTGVGTNFLTDFTTLNNYSIIIPRTGNNLEADVYTVSSVNSNTSLTISTDFQYDTLSNVIYGRFYTPDIKIDPSLKIVAYIVKRRIMVPFEFSMV